MVQIPTSQTQETQSSFPDSAAKKEFPIIPNDSIVNVEVVECELRDFSEDFRAQYGVKDKQEVSFRFRVTDGDYKGLNIWGSAKPIFDSSDNCRLRIWTQEILGVDKLPEGFVFDTDDLVGMNTRVLVSEYRKKKGGLGNRVKDVLRANANTPNATVSYNAEEPF